MVDGHSREVKFPWISLEKPTIRDTTMRADLLGGDGGRVYHLGFRYVQADSVATWPVAKGYSTDTPGKSRFLGFP